MVHDSEAALWYDEKHSMERILTNAPRPADSSPTHNLPPSVGPVISSGRSLLPLSSRGLAAAPASPIRRRVGCMGTMIGSGRRAAC